MRRKYRPVAVDAQQQERTYDQSGRHHHDPDENGQGLVVGVEVASEDEIEECGGQRHRCQRPADTYPEQGVDGRPGQHRRSHQQGPDNPVVTVRMQRFEARDQVEQLVDRGGVERKDEADNGNGPEERDCQPPPGEDRSQDGQYRHRGADVDPAGHERRIEEHGQQPGQLESRVRLDPERVVVAAAEGGVPAHVQARQQPGRREAQPGEHDTATDNHHGDHPV